MALGVHLALLACLHQPAPPSLRGGTADARSLATPAAQVPYLGLTFSAKSVAVLTRAYVLQEIERILRSTNNRWALVERRVAARGEPRSLQLATVRSQVSGMLRDVRRERVMQLRDLRQTIGPAARLPGSIRSPDIALASPWLWRNLDDREAAITEANAAALRAAHLESGDRTPEPAVLDSPAPTRTDQHIFARIDALIHCEVLDTAPESGLVQELRLQVVLAYFYARRRLSYEGALVREAEQLRQDTMAAWRSGEVKTAQMIAAELECLSVEVASLEALFGYEAALARVQAIIDRS